ncbi:MAG: type I-E CRISPR-associated protein Cas7/Cse4/CasC [Candidatus Methanomethylophilaceae archaeon]|nr:type I-E CRISPR-associated protein Cas7/Cse4/CasC [Candidatus Cloacimonadota bacterium]MCK9322339.1 type I-E CRISPR-associated protein Cas7/Cse4/CasC [Candidatus Methanomethylophilaceae archaeon]
MEKRLYIDMHIIQTVPPSCVNRDDTGSPKTAVYGGVRRARVSSQSWKRAMRDCFNRSFDESELSIRTKKIVELVAEEIIKKDKSINSDDAKKKANEIISTAGIKTKVSKTDDTLEAQALFFISRKQAENLAILALSNKKIDKKDAQNALNKGHGIDLALFGRMVADDPSLNADASAQIAHSISTHKVENEYDYFTAVDERSPEDNSGAGMIGTIEFNSSTLYRYATVAVHDLKKQLDDPEITAKVISEFAKVFTISMPTGKQNTFANRTLPTAMLISVRTDQPLNLVAAFESPISADTMAGYGIRSAERLAEYEKEVCCTFTSAPVKTWQIGKGLELIGNAVDLQTALDELRQYVKDCLAASNSEDSNVDKLNEHLQES